MAFPSVSEPPFAAWVITHREGVLGGWSHESARCTDRSHLKFQPQRDLQCWEGGRTQLSPDRAYVTWGPLSKYVPRAPGTVAEDKSCPEVCLHHGARKLWDKAVSILPRIVAPRRKAKVRSATNVLEDLKAISAALHRGNLQGFHPPDRTNLLMDASPSPKGQRAGESPSTHHLGCSQR